MPAGLHTDAGPNLPQGTVAEVHGTLSYAGGFTAKFYAALEQEGGAWRLFSITIDLPPGK
jgi:hypothetical protein